MKRTIKAIFSGVLCIAVCWSLASCKNSQNTGDAHGHSEEIHEGHSHEGHDHEGHVHSHDEAHEGHDHNGHSHESDIHAEGEGSPDEIILSEESAAAAGVKAETVLPGKFRSVLEVSGRVMPAPGNESTIVANVPGVVSLSAPLVEGSRVNEGTPMFSISSSHLQDGDPVQRARIAYETARKEFERASKLVEDNIVSRQEYEAAKGRYETARLTYEALAADKDGNGTVVKSPVNGYVESCLVKEGDYVSVGTPLASVLSGNGMYLKADVSERYLDRLPGVNAANFRLSYSDKIYSTAGLNGRLLGYGRSTDETNAYIPVTFSINASTDILAGAYARIWLLSDEREGVISLPVDAVTEEQGHYFVYIQLDPTCYRKQEVTLGATDGNRYEILTGLHGGETVVTHGAIHVKLASASNAIPAHTHNH
ncbi:MAG TPA: efflux RND transporter periplasmic adaptor subunit [Candidatus Coprenecus pullicola]|nr:efflux RND transporter periplasmic adaptor subunit [Candidatus Coprenecus pullicola]